MTQGIDEQLNRLHEKELDGSQRHMGASIMPVRNLPPVRNRSDSDLDALSRLMTGPGDTCTALCFDSTGKLLVANNSGNEAFFREYATLLSQYITDPFKANYQLLVEDAQKKSNDILNSEKIKTKISNLDIEAQARFATLAKVIAILEDENATPQLKNIAAEILQPVMDTRRIAYAIAQGGLDAKIIGALSTPNEEMQFIQGQRDMHAEMKIVDYLEETNQLNETTYTIGLSKLCCCACAVTLSGVTEKYKTKFLTPGTHGGTYTRWEAPAGMQEIALAELEKLKGGEHEKYTESTVDPMMWKSTLSQPVLSEFQDISALQEAMVRTRAALMEAQELSDNRDQERRELDALMKESKELLEPLDKVIKEYNLLEDRQGQLYREKELQLERLEGSKKKLKENVIELNKLETTHKEKLNSLLAGLEKAEGGRAKSDYDNLMRNYNTNTHFLEKEIKKSQQAFDERKSALKKVEEELAKTEEEIKNPKYDNISEIRKTVEEIKEEVQKAKLETNKNLSDAEGIFTKTSTLNKELQGANKKLFELTKQEVSEGIVTQKAELLIGGKGVEAQGNAHLKNTEKSALSDLTSNYNLGEQLAALNQGGELSNTLNRIDREAAITANLDIRSIDAQKNIDPKSRNVRVMGEDDHLNEHRNNVESLIEGVTSGKIGKDTVIAIERKEYGENLGMKDVIKLAAVMEHNEKQKEESQKLVIPEEVIKSPIYQDAILYKTANEHGVKVIGLEGRNLEHGKDSPLYNKNREQYMVDVINEVRNKGYNVIAHVGSSHVANLEKGVKEASAKEAEGLSGIPRSLIDKAKEIGASVGTYKTSNARENVGNVPARNESQSLGR